MSTADERRWAENAEHERRASAEAEFYARRDQHEREFPDQWGPFGKGTIAASLTLVLVAGAFMVLSWIFLGTASLLLGAVSWISETVGVSLQTAGWLFAVAVLAGVFALVRASRARSRRRREHQVAALGFRSAAAYDAAAASRVRRLGKRRYRQLVQELLKINREATGRSKIPDLAEFERALAWTASRHGIDVTLQRDG
jgi:hypothetical protein